MKTKKLTTIDERFNNEYVLKDHFKKHVTVDGQPSDPNFPNDVNFVLGKDFEQSMDGVRAYDKAADDLARKRAAGIESDDDNAIVGFMEEAEYRGKHRICKYCPATRESTIYVVENGEPINLSYFPLDRNRWERMKRSNKGCLEIPKELEDAICRD